MSDWKTTVGGIGMILTAIGPVLFAIGDGNPNTSPDWNVAVMGIIGGISFIFSGDAISMFNRKKQ